MRMNSNKSKIIMFVGILFRVKNDVRHVNMDGELLSLSRVLRSFHR